jgi:predicted CoA-substrate-specific enzyme activase
VKRSFGICLGASAVSIAERCEDNIKYSRIQHDGKVAAVFQDIIRDILPATVGITGRKFRSLLDLETVSEPEAVELAYNHIKHSLPDIDCIVSAGGETFLVYVLNSKGTIRKVRTGNKCASGTGEFFMQQLQRMELSLDAMSGMVCGAEPYMMAARCSVFCKSDCTHALNKGASKGNIAAGLCKMIAGKIIELLKMSRAKRIAIVGGVSNNSLVIDYVREVYPETFVPEGADCFEALGALLWAEQKNIFVEPQTAIIKKAFGSFASLPNLESGLGKVSFKSAPRGEIVAGEYILGLDVGSTTTKAILLRRDTLAITAACYLRTNGDPVCASRDCYRDILTQIPSPEDVKIVGLGVTGSGRQIAGLHALTNGVINEIVAHAAAAVHFDPEVETIFEIGGQDAKYTYITNMVASDYAMNEACSAGTGSFLEEASHESLGIDTLEIGDIAFTAESPMDFNDQCAAFIGSDIKTAVQEQSSRADIVAGLVYSICQNYLNRVKGNRPVGKKIFMQGGVCYNHAVPVAMANLCGQNIIVPPEPGLMGAFGAALETHRKINQRLLEKQSFDLSELAGRTVEYREPFVCGGGRDGCDRRCNIARIAINGQVYPFGGACDLYYSQRRRNAPVDTSVDLVKLREEMVYNKYTPAPPENARLTVGIPASLFSNTFFPLYTNFFTNLGIRTVLGDKADAEGMDSAGAPFCFPMIISHGLVKDLINRKVDYIFLPHVKSSALPADEDATTCTCPFVQGEPYCMQAAFHDDLESRLLTDVLNFDNPAELTRVFTNIGMRLGCSRKESQKAFESAWAVMLAMVREAKEIGRRFLANLKPEETAIVMFGRPYNAFTRLGNMGIPHKFTSRGYKVIPYDFLPIEEVDNAEFRQMYWTSGHGILKAGRFITKTPNLFGVYITNFSCGPDSFITGYFRDIMGQKPSLTLELDAHTADAGVDTRIEAFLDVIRGYRELNLPPAGKDNYAATRVIMKNGSPYVLTGDGRELSFTDPRVTVLVPSMGDTASRSLVAALRYIGINAEAADPPGREELSLAKGEATCKECLPLLLVSGSLIKYLRDKFDRDKILVYFMPSTDGPCRFGQYNVFLDHYFRKNRLENVALITLSGENGYMGMSPEFVRRVWMGVIISDGLDDIYAGIMALAKDRAAALTDFDRATGRILKSLEKDGRPQVLNIIEKEMTCLAGFERKKDICESVKVNLTGEVYVRRDAFSRQNIIKLLADQGALVRVTPLSEWLYYSEYCVRNDLANRASWSAKFNSMIKTLFMRRYETDIQKRLALSKFYEPCRPDINYLMAKGSSLINPELTGEAILTVSSTLAEVGDETHGVISIGPFGCMPCRIAESILTCRLWQEKAAFSRHHKEFWEKNSDELPLPFLAIECDGNPFPQVVQARIESFLLAAQRLKEGLKTGAAC